MTDLSHLKADFPILRRQINGQPLHFLDSGASSQKPVQVIEAMSAFMETNYANVHRGAYTLSLEATEAYESCRRAVAGFINAASDSEVVFTRGATTALNTVAFGWGRRNLKPGDRILLTVMEHHANLVPWQMVAAQTGAEVIYTQLTADWQLDLEHLRSLLDERVKVVGVSGMSNVLGTVPPVGQIASMAHEVGAIVVVDGAQLVPHRAVDVQALGADFLAFSSHKMLGPTGLGILWGRLAVLEQTDPFEGGGEMISEVTLEGSTWAAIPHRFEAGTPPIVETVGLEAAIGYLQKAGMDAVADHDRDLTIRAIERLTEFPGVTMYGPPAGADRGSAVSFTLSDVHPHDLATILDQEGVAVRAGHHCAKPLHRILGVPATARASFYVYNDEEDIEALIGGLATAARVFGVD